MSGEFYFTDDAANPNNRRVHGKTCGQICKVYGWDSEVARAKAQHVVDALNAYDTSLILSPSERQYLLRLLGGSLDGECGLKAEGVLVLRGKIEGAG